MATKIKMTPKSVFGAGCGATLTIYAVYFLKHMDMVGGLLDTHSVGFLFAAALALLIVAGAAGAWTYFSEPTSMRQALSIGLGVPALLFAMDIGSPDASVGVNKSSLFPSFLAAGDGSWWGGFSLIFAPVSSVEQHVVDEYQPKVDRLEDQQAHTFATLDIVTQVVDSIRSTAAEGKTLTAEGKTPDRAKLHSLFTSVETDTATTADFVKAAKAPPPPPTGYEGTR